MDQAVHFVTIATLDLDAARRFYTSGLGWTPLADVPDEVLFFQVAPGLVLGFFDSERFVEDAGGEVPGRLGGVTLSHNLPDEAAVDAAVARLVAAGGVVAKEPQRAGFGGYHAHIVDPNGLVWEIAHNPGWSIAADGTVSLAAPPPQ